jgi:NADH-ubiquinone oxidoreductase chain 5
MFIGLGSSFWNNAIFVIPTNEKLLLSEFGVPFFIKLIPVFFSFLGAILAFIFYFSFKNMLYLFKYNKFNLLYKFLSKKWFFDKVYNDFIVQNFLNFGYKVSYKQVDRGIVEMFGPFGVSHQIYFQGIKNSMFQTGFIYHYLFVMISGISIISLFIFYF